MQHKQMSEQPDTFTESPPNGLFLVLKFLDQFNLVLVCNGTNFVNL
jgi:hypothetical protein